MQVKARRWQASDLACTFLIAEENDGYSLPEPVEDLKRVMQVCIIRLQNSKRTFLCIKKICRFFLSLCNAGKSQNLVMLKGIGLVLHKNINLQVTALYEYNKLNC